MPLRNLTASFAVVYLKATFTIMIRLFPLWFLFHDWHVSDINEEKLRTQLAWFSAYLIPRSQRWIQSCKDFSLQDRSCKDFFSNRKNKELIILTERMPFAHCFKKGVSTWEPKDNISGGILKDRLLKGEILQFSVWCRCPLLAWYCQSLCGAKTWISLKGFLRCSFKELCKVPLKKDNWF